ncbi:MAG: energy-coupling factor transporter transmembrane component T [candidate division KSB1 bacterium]|jgi:energy-coupling factor transport system permease protein|nr:energy-coupling factor transporter transmembrane component T [candidate division KSB1 bacterium]
MPVLNDITLGHYYPVDSFVHKLDPRTKLIATFTGMTGLLFAHQFYGLIIISIVILISIRASQIPGKLIFGNLRPFLWLFLLTFIIHMLFSQGTPIYTIPYINLTIGEEGISNGIVFSMRLVLIITIAAILTLATSPIEITDALEVMFSPLKRFGVPTHDLTMMMTLSLRFIPTLMMEADKLRKAQISRGVQFEGKIIQRLRNMIPLILPLFLSVFRRADELALAMDARCYNGGEGRTRFKQLRFHLNDYYVLAGTLIIFIFMIVS